MDAQVDGCNSIYGIQYLVSTILTNRRKILILGCGGGPNSANNMGDKRIYWARSEGRKQDILSILQGSCGQDQEGVCTWGEKLGFFHGPLWSPLD